MCNQKLLLFFRYKVKTFEIEMDSELHGFGGYFECTLYKDIMISINPNTHSPGLFYFRSAVCLLFFSREILPYIFSLFTLSFFSRNVFLVSHIFSVKSPNEIEGGRQIGVTLLEIEKFKRSLVCVNYYSTV